MRERQQRYQEEIEGSRHNEHGRTQAQHSHMPPKPPTRTGVATAEMSPKPSKEQIVASLKSMSKNDLEYILAAIKQLLSKRR